MKLLAEGYKMPHIVEVAIDAATRERETDETDSYQQLTTRCTDAYEDRAKVMMQMALGIRQLHVSEVTHKPMQNLGLRAVRRVFG